MKCSTAIKASNKPNAKESKPSTKESKPNAKSTKGKQKKEAIANIYCDSLFLYLIQIPYLIQILFDLLLLLVRHPMLCLPNAYGFYNFPLRPK